MRTNISSTVDIENFYQTITPYLFFALFAGFVLYHLGIAYQLIPAFAGGYFGIASLIVAVIYVLRIPKILSFNFKSNLVVSFVHISIFIYALAVTLISAAYEYNFNHPVVIQSLNTLTLWVSLFTLGFYLVRSNTQKTFKLNYLFFILFSIYIIFYIVTTQSVMFNLSTVLSDETEGVSGYQSLARNLFVICLFLLSFSSKAVNIITFILTSVFVLFFLGARSEFAVFLLLSAVYMLLKSRNNYKYFIISLISILLTSILFIIFKDNILDSRQFQLLDYSDSSSWNARERLKEEGMKTIFNNPVFGSFGAHAASGDIGRYIHNSLSAYVNYGLYFFISYIFISLYATTLSFLNILKTNSNVWTFSFLINLGCLLLIIFAKPVFWPIPFLAWGVFFGAKSIKNRAQEVNP